MRSITLVVKGAKASGGKGKVVGLEGPPSAPTSRDRVRGLKETLARFPNIELLGLSVGHLQQAPAKTAMAALLGTVQNVAAWWLEHPGVPREEVVTATSGFLTRGLAGMT